MLTLSSLLSVLMITVVLQPTVNSIPEGCPIRIEGSIGDANTTVEHVAEINKELYPQLKELLGKDYFRFVAANLYNKCKFWPEDGQCVLRACQIEDCSITSVPPGLRIPPDNAEEPTSFRVVGVDRADSDCKDEEESLTLGKLDPTLSSERKDAINSWADFDRSNDTLFCEPLDEASDKLIYVDLLRNQEKYTGYKGPSANRVWSAIYRENCFDTEPPRFFYTAKMSPVDTRTCKEKRLFYRLISGFHTSTAVQLCYNYLLSNFGSASAFMTDASKVWGPNVEEFLRRFHPAKEPQSLSRLRNLHLAYVVELRAIAKAAPLLRQHSFFTGNAELDENTRKDVSKLLDLIEANGHVFDETQLFPDAAEDMLQLKTEFRQHFYNISRIMDCVGCDKCKLWGKIQTQGMGTALKILFSGDIYDRSADNVIRRRPDFQLRRTDIVSLFHALGKLGSSIEALETFSTHLQNPESLVQARGSHAAPDDRIVDFDGILSYCFPFLLIVAPGVGADGRNGKFPVEDHPPMVGFFGTAALAYPGVIRRL
ncbi:hypothetical protein AAHC03_09894 [Spirometra sp. Aus1]